MDAGLLAARFVEESVAQPVHRQHGHFVAAFDTELFFDVLAVRLDRLRAEVQHRSDLGGLQPLPDVAQDLKLAIRQA